MHFYLVEDVSETQHRLVIKVTGKAPHSSIERKIQLNWAFPQLFEKTYNIEMELYSGRL